MALIAKNGKNQFDYVEFASDKDVYAMVDAWAASNGYVLKRSEGDARKYQKGSGFLTAPMFLELNRVGATYSIKSYVRINGFVLHGDVGLAGDGFLVKLPRSIAKKAQNQLFQSLELQPLQ
ncbi:hypothetical protein IEQ11_19180 [Lysobacter capsici]|uniref:Uncharacterized protein n=1 Tax=Lysobacter capsici AZ78 TaxID=1444315 RepID=A0A108UCS5_9GAMM|nr:hypothetical protein [Lysobacter capsici]ALN87432.1 hypothetical protein LC55x_4181 [Lysobacter capsici]ATE73208.1 hypothetical protein CNO08_18710 [Lysobacter capsici]KWS06794.1 hypothetical protein AZ78_4352 [Lysobacter capsici AZ78]UOF13843.1 hypothetical protein IEQ11_19180 [Lysobacter capsici]WND79373.1 hypothetical protein RJ610_19030 [Lysobacter capsici]